MKKIICAVALSLVAILPEAWATQYSCLSIITATKKIGKWEALKAWIAAAGLEDEWGKCNYVSDTYPQYTAVTNALVTGGVFTVDEIAGVLSESKDTAVPDDLLHRVYSNDMSNHTGRVKWHGAAANVVFDTNALVKTTYYADGYTFREAFLTKVPPSVQSQLSAAERKVLAERRKAEQAAREAARKQARIDLLTTNMTAEVSALMARNDWPEELARLYLQNELNKLVGTRTVDAVVTPQN